MEVSSEELAAAAARLQVWAFPLVFAQRVRLNFTLPLTPDAARPATSAGAPVNRFGHQRALSDPDLRVGVAPNVDTLYSVAWVDLDTGPYVLRAPDFGDRYYSLQFALADTRSPWALGQRTHGGALPPVRLVRGELAYGEHDGGIELVTPHRYLMVCGRTLVEPEDPGDLVRAARLQDLLQLEALGPPAPRRLEPAEAELAALPREAELTRPGAFGRALAAVVRDSAPDTVPAWVHEDVARCGLDVARGGAEAALAEGLATGLEAVRARVRTLGEVVHGWALTPQGPEFGDDDLLRAAVALSQIFINPAVEATYPVCEVDDTGAVLDGRAAAYTWTLVPDDPPPVDAFWSLTLYHAAGLLAANELGRYAIGDRTPGTVRGEDGSLTVHVSTTPPADGVANWLPAPKGPFRLMLRLYVPRDPAWAPPPVVRVR